MLIDNLAECTLQYLTITVQLLQCTDKALVVLQPLRVLAFDILA